MKLMLRATSALAIASFALVLAATPASAQSATDAPAAGEELAPAEIVVTAQKRTERLQDVPVAVSVLSGDAINSSSKPNLEGATQLVPSLNFVKSGSALNQALFLRGLGTTTLSIAVEPSVSTVLDGVVLSRAAEAFTDLVDIERIEVLRGPQGTLFGKNASAGVINITSRRPGDTVAGQLEAAVYFGNGTEYRVRGAVDLPLGKSVRSRTTAFYDTYDGNLTNVAAGNRRVNGLEHYGIRTLVEADASDTVKLTLIADYSKNNDDCCAEAIGGPPLFASTSATPGAVNTTNLAIIQSVLPPILGDQTRAVNQNRVTQSFQTSYGFSGQADIELGKLTLTSITAYRNFASNELRDGDFYPQPFIGAPQSHDTGPQTGYTVTQELRITSPGNEFFNYVLGGFYSYTYTNRVFRRDNLICSAVTGAVLPTGVLTPCTSPLANPIVAAFGQSTYSSTGKNLAIFAQSTLNITDRFRLIAGLRYTHDDLGVSFIRVTSPGNLASNPPFDQGVFDSRVNEASNGSPAASNAVPFRTKTSSDNVSGKAGVQFDFSRNVTAYATYSRGYKGPAYNLFFNLQATGVKALEPETSNAYEVGLKTTSLGGALTINFAGYYAQYYNFQANNPDTLTINGVTSVIGRFTNAGTVSTRGFEVDFAYRPNRDLTISGGIAYTDAHIDSFRPPAVRTPNDVVPDGTRLPYAPRFKGSVAIDYTIRTGGKFNVALGLQGNYQSDQDAGLTPDPVVRRAVRIDGYGIVNASIALVDVDDKYKLTFFARNLFDQTYSAFIQGGGPLGSYRYQIPRDADRYLGVSGRVNF